MIRPALFVSLVSLVMSFLAPAAAAATDDLYRTIAERLSYMQAVAAWKVENDRPVEDLEREQVVLEAARSKAREQGLAGAQVTGFFEAQIEAAKDIQSCWIDRWNSGVQPPGTVPDLVSEVRPALLRLGGSIISQLAEASVTSNDRTAFENLVEVECLSNGAREKIFEGLLAVANP